MVRLLLILLPLALSGCAAVGGYLRDRGADAADVIALQGSVGFGLAVDVKATDALHLGLGYADVRAAGVHGRELVWQREREVGLPLSALLWIGALRDGQLERLGSFHAGVGELWRHNVQRWGELEVGAVLGVVGARVGVSLFELVDFLAGLVTLDPLGDDRGLEPPPEELPEEQGVWLAGDLHDHSSPPDREHHAQISPTESAELAATNGLDFLGINPHLWSSSRLNAASGRKFGRLLAELEALVARDDVPLLIPGFEATLRSDYVDWEWAPLGDLELERLAARDQQTARYPAWVPSGHALILLRDFELFSRLTREATERESWQTVGRWLREVPREQRLWVPTHPMHERLQIPVFPDWAVPWPGLEGNPQLPRLLRAVDDLVLREAPRADAAPVASASRTARLVGTGRAEGGWLEVRVPGEVEVSQLEARPKLAWAPAAGLEARESDQPYGGIYEQPIDGLEAISGLLHLAEAAVGRTGAERAWDQVFATLDRRIQRDRRRYTVLAGSDNHRDLVFPTLWVFARERSTPAVFDALREGRLCVGGDEARWFRARTDRVPGWRYVGAALAAEREVELRWRGAAELFVDGVSQGRLRDGFVHAIEPASFHAYRIECGRSRSAWIYVNLPIAEPR